MSYCVACVQRKRKEGPPRPSVARKRLHNYYAQSSARNSVPGAQKSYLERIVAGVLHTQASKDTRHFTLAAAVNSPTDLSSSSHGHMQLSDTAHAAINNEDDDLLLLPEEGIDDGLLTPFLSAAQMSAVSQAQHQPTAAEV